LPFLLLKFILESDHDYEDLTWSSSASDTSWGVPSVDSRGFFQFKPTSAHRGSNTITVVAKDNTYGFTIKEVSISFVIKITQDLYPPICSATAQSETNFDFKSHSYVTTGS
jgi:hypothetical protein